MLYSATCIDGSWLVGVKMITRAIATIAVAGLLTTAAAAGQIPTWDIAEVCRVDSAPGQCRMFESRARNAVSASWSVLPADVRTACIAATRSPADQGWRALAGCIELKTLHEKSARAIATATTPAEAESPAQVKDEPAAAEPASSEPATPQVAPTEPGSEPGKAG